MAAERNANARRRARELLHRFGVRAPEHVRVEAFAASLGIELLAVRLDGAQAQLARNGQRAVIMVSDQVTDPQAQRFSIAHELGHFVLSHPSRSASELCVPYMANSARDHEAEANAFASELLMPASLLGRTCDVSPVDLAVPRAIARDYNVSILAATIRFTELASERCAAVFSAGGVVKWVTRSATFTQRIERGQRVDESSIAWDYFARGELDDEPQPVPADAWLDTVEAVDIVEHSICSRELGTVLSMLWVPEAVAAALGMGEGTAES